jgi:hypothetical protein
VESGWLGETSKELALLGFDEREMPIFVCIFSSEILFSDLQDKLKGFSILIENIREDKKEEPKKIEKKESEILFAIPSKEIWKDSISKIQEIFPDIPSIVLEGISAQQENQIIESVSSNLILYYIEVTFESEDFFEKLCS